jgi:hypothetical protein
MLKQILIGLVGGVTLMMSSLLNADVLGETDDSYIGFQITIPFDTGSKELFSRKNEYSLMLINQTDGIKKGIAFTQDIKGKRTMGYILPSQTFKIGQSRVSDYTMPIISLNEGGEPNISHVSGGEGVIVVVGVIAAGIWFVNELAKEMVNCIDPDVVSEEIIGC